MTLLSLAAALVLSTDPSCGAIDDQIQAAQARLEAGDARRAQSLAEDAAADAPACVDAHLMLVQALEQRLESAGGLSALGLSRRYRRAVADALEIDPDNVDARRAQIGYLIHAPGIAGGDRERASELIGELQALDALAGASMRLELARAEGGAAEILSALAALTGLDPDNHGLRSEYARRLIVSGSHEAAERELLDWPDGDARLEAERAYLRGGLRVLGEFDLHTAEALLTLALQVEIADTEGRRRPPPDAIWALIGSAREGLGNPDGARAAYTRALELEPDNARASEGLARLSSP